MIKRLKVLGMFTEKVNKNKHDQSIQNNKWQGEKIDQELFTLPRLRRKGASTEMAKS